MEIRDSLELNDNENNTVANYIIVPNSFCSTLGKNYTFQPIFMVLQCSTCEEIYISQALTSCLPSDLLWPLKCEWTDMRYSEQKSLRVTALCLLS